MEVVPLLEYFAESVLCNFELVIPEVAVVALVLAREAFAGHTEIIVIAFGLMLFDADALDVEPLVAFLAADHEGVFVGNPVPANAILLRVIDH